MTEWGTMTKTKSEVSEPVMRWVWRTLLLSVPLHLMVFSLLFFGGVRLVEDEMLEAHARDSQMLLELAVDNLHLAMLGAAEDPEPEVEVHRRLRELATSYEALSLRIFDAAGQQIAGEAAEARDAQEVIEILAGGPEERFWLLRQDEGTFMRGILRIRADERCVPCHDDGELRELPADHDVPL